MMILLLLFARRHDSPGFELVASLILGSLVIVSIFWERAGRRRYQQWKARSWPVAQGKFNEGEIIPMLKGRSKDIAGYVVCIDYDYSVGKPYDGVYYTREFPTQEAAAECLRRLENQPIPVRIAPDKPHKSQIVDRDLASLMPPS